MQCNRAATAYMTSDVKSLSTEIARWLSFLCTGLQTSNYVLRCAICLSDCMECCFIIYHLDRTSFSPVCSRYDYEQVASEAATGVMNSLKSFVENQSLINTEHSSCGHTYVIDKFDDFEYSDPIDQSVSKNQVTYRYSIVSMLCVISTVVSDK